MQCMLFSLSLRWHEKWLCCCSMGRLMLCLTWGQSCPRPAQHVCPLTRVHVELYVPVALGDGCHMTVLISAVLVIVRAVPLPMMIVLGAR